MKKLITSAILSILALGAEKTVAQTVTYGKLTFTWTITQQETNNLETGTTTTNKPVVTAKGTNVTTVSTGVAKTTKPVTFDTKDLIALLGTSLNTTFPTNSYLVVDQDANVYVATNSTSLISVSSVLTLSAPVILESGQSAIKTTLTYPKKGGGVTGTVTGGGVIQEMFVGVLSYDDSSLVATNKVSKFKVIGLAKGTDVVAEVGNALAEKVSYTTSGSVGEGTISGVPSLITDGTLSGSYKVQYPPTTF